MARSGGTGLMMQWLAMIWLGCSPATQDARGPAGIGNPDWASFTLELPSNSLTIRQNQSIEVPVAVVGLDDDDQPVVLEFLELPAGVQSLPVQLHASDHIGEIVLEADDRVVQGGPHELELVARSGDRQAYLEVPLFIAGDAGTPDQSFGIGGVVQLPGGIGDHLTLDRHGRVVVTATLDHTAGDTSDYVVRLTPWGEVDPSFAQGGHLRVPATFEAFEASPLSADELLLVGDARGSRQLVVTRIGDDGEVVRGFGDRGTVNVAGARVGLGIGTARWVFFRGPSGIHAITEHGGEVGPLERASDHLGSLVAAAPDPHGGSVLAGRWADTFQAAIIRLLPTGEPDAAFGDDGVLVLPQRSSYPTTFIQDLALDDVGEGVVLASSSVDGRNFFVYRFHADGTPDLGFGAEGVARPFVDDWAVAEAVLLDDGRVALAGRTFSGGPQPVLAVLGADGTPDLSFGTGGALFVPRLPYAVHLDRLANRLLMLVEPASGQGVEVRRIWL